MPCLLAAILKSKVKDVVAMEVEVAAMEVEVAVEVCMASTALCTLWSCQSRLHLGVSVGGYQSSSHLSLGSHGSCHRK